MANTEQTLRSAFHRVTMMLLGLFEVHRADPDLVDQAAEELEAIVREHLPSQQRPGIAGKLTLERLLDEFEHADTAGARH